MLSQDESYSDYFDYFVTVFFQQSWKSSELQYSTYYTKLSFFPSFSTWKIYIPPLWVFSACVLISEMVLYLTLLLHVSNLYILQVRMCTSSSSELSIHICHIHYCFVPGGLRAPCMLACAMRSLAIVITIVQFCFFFSFSVFCFWPTSENLPCAK